jgi:uncharacterized protein with gpF-like domain
MPSKYVEPPQPQTAIDFLKRKKTKVSINWDDYKQGEHSHIFTVAHSDEADVVDAIYRILNEPYESGAAFGTVKSQFLDMMRDVGWYGKKDKENDKEYIN